MTNCIFYSLFFVLFLNVSVGSLKYSQIHRTFLSLYKGMFEASTITVSSLGNSITPYFDSSKVETYIGKYFSKNKAYRELLRDIHFTDGIINTETDMSSDSSHQHWRVGNGQAPSFLLSRPWLSGLSPAFHSPFQSFEPG